MTNNLVILNEMKNLGVGGDFIIFTHQTFTGLQPALQRLSLFGLRLHDFTAGR